MVTLDANILQIERDKEALCIYYTCTMVQDTDFGSQ